MCFSFLSIFWKILKFFQHSNILKSSKYTMTHYAHLSVYVGKILFDKNCVAFNVVQLINNLHLNTRLDTDTTQSILCPLSFSNVQDFLGFLKVLVDAMKNSKQKMDNGKNWKMPCFSWKENIVYCQLISRKTDFTGQTLERGTYFITHWNTWNTLQKNTNRHRNKYNFTFKNITNTDFK